MKSQSIFAMIFIAIATITVATSVNAEVLRIPLSAEHCVAAGCPAEVAEVPQPAKAVAPPAERKPLAIKSVVSRKHDPLKPFTWRKRGGDPCRSEAGCTKEWMLKELQTYDGWPQEVVDAVIKAIESGENSMIMVCDGQLLAMSFGMYVAKFSLYTTIEWGKDECETAMYWPVDFNDTRYHFVKVQICGNWGGWKTAAPADLVTEPVARRRRLGILPITECPPDDTTTQHGSGGKS